MAIAKLLERSRRKDIPIAMVEPEEGAGLPMKSHIPPAEMSKTAAERYPEFSPMKSTVPPNHMTKKNGTTIPPKIKPKVLIGPCAWTFLEDPRSPEEGLSGAKFDSPVCCCAAFCRSPPLVMLNMDVKETVIKQSPWMLQLRAFRE
jgi:hypothetical protein